MVSHPSKSDSQWLIKQLSVIYLALFLSILHARSSPIVNFNDVIISHPPFSGINPDGGLGLDNEGGRTRREPGQPVFSSIDDDAYPTERVKEERSDMVELLDRYAPVFKLSYVLRFVRY
jgi:hypothetical protein